MHSVILRTSHVSEVSCHLMFVAVLIILSSASEDQELILKIKEEFLHVKSAPCSHFYRSPSVRNLLYVCLVVDEMIQT